MSTHTFMRRQLCLTRRCTHSALVQPQARKIRCNLRSCQLRSEQSALAVVSTTRVLCFAILLSPDMHQNVKASSRRSRHHVWEASQPRSHRSCAVHGLESRRLGAAGISNAPDRYRGPEYSQPQRVARPPRVLYTVVHQRSSYTQDAGLHLAQRHWDGTQTMRSREAYTESRSHACLHATALLQIAGAQPHAVGTHIRSSDHIRGDGPSMRAGRGVGLSVSHASGRSARAVIQSSVQEQSVPLTLSVTSACHSAPVRVLDGSATGVSHTGSLCVERLVPTFGSQSHTRIHTQTRKHSAGAHVPPSSVFVTGGLGALGQSSTAWYTHLGARYAYVTGRSGRGGSALLRWVSQTGTHNGVLHVSRADASVMDEGSCSGMHAHTRVRAHSVLHAGGVLRDSVTARQSALAHRYVWSSKVTAARVLLQQWAGVERGTRRTTLFSSVAALLGSPGQCNYSGANAALDATATEEWYRGNAVCAMQWGAWDGAGMALSNPAILKQAHTSGIGILDPRAGLGAMRAVLDETDVGRYWRGARGILAVVPFQWSVLMRTYRRRALIAEYSVEPKKDTLRDANALPSTNQGRARSSDETVSQLVASAVTRALGRDISAEASLMEEGLDSLAAVELGGALQKETGVAMPATLAFDYPTIKAIAGYVNNAMIESSEAHTSDAVVRTSSTEPNAAIRDEQHVHAYTKRIRTTPATLAPKDTTHREQHQL